MTHYRICRDMGHGQYVPAFSNRFLSLGAAMDAHAKNPLCIAMKRLVAVRCVEGMEPVEVHRF